MPIESSYDFLKKIKDGYPSEDWPAVAKLIGADYVRLHAWEMGTLLGTLYDEPSNTPKWQSIFEHCSRINRRTAFRIFAFLPAPVVDASAWSEDRRKSALYLEHFYLGSAWWLLSWDIDLPLGRALEAEGFGRYQKYARLAELRYQMIRRLCELQAIPFIKPAFPWLLSEIAACLEGLAKAGEVSSKKQLYDETRRYLEDLKAKQVETYTSDNLDEVMLSFHYWIDHVASYQADSDKSFEHDYQRPYLSALKSWNVARKELTLLTANPLPGPRIGRKYQKD